MNRKRNVNYIKPEDPAFLKALKKQVGYDDSNHKFDELQNAEEDFVEDDDSEQPQVVVLKDGDLTAEEAEIEKKKLEKIEAEIKADLSQKIIFKARAKDTPTGNKKRKTESVDKSTVKKGSQLLSFNDEDEEDASSSD